MARKGQTMSERQIIVFETSDIFNYEGLANGPVRFTFEDHNGDTKKLCSTGVLEWALEGGCEVFVASTRSHLLESDEWWTKLVAADHIFLSDEPVDGALTERDASSGWKRLFERLNVEWPDDEHWVNARMELENHDVTLAWRIRAGLQRMANNPEAYRKWSRLNRKYESVRAMRELIEHSPPRGVAGAGYGAFVAHRTREKKS